MCQKRFGSLTQLLSCPINPLKNVSRYYLNPSDLDPSGQIPTFLQCCVSGTFIPDPNFSIPDPGSDLFQPGSRIRIEKCKYFNPRKNGF